MNKKQKTQPDTVKHIVAANLKKYRDLKGLSQKQLAHMVGVAHNTISSWENAVNSIDADSLCGLCKALNITANDLYSCNINNEPSLISSVSIQKPSLLDEDEEKLLSAYRSVNKQGQEQIIDYVDYIASSSKYKKSNEYAMVENSS